ncbi:two-component sensor histidine kinase, partial [Streptomyces sp. NPDC057062]
MSRWKARIGLRTRLVLAFLLVAAIGAGTTAALAYRAARTAILVQAQDTAVSSFRDQIEQWPTALPVDRRALQKWVQQLARRGKPHPWVVFAEYGSLRISSGTRPVSTVITPELRRAALATPGGSFQRVNKAGMPWLTVAVPTVFTAGRTTRPTGLVLYSVMPLTDEETNIRAMLTAAGGGGRRGRARGGGGGVCGANAR